MISAELLAQFAEVAEREARRGEEECPLIPGSDAALALQALVGDDLINIVRARLDAERSSEAA